MNGKIIYGQGQQWGYLRSNPSPLMKDKYCEKRRSL